MTAVTAYAATGSLALSARLAHCDPASVHTWVADSPERLEEIRKALQRELMPEMVAAARRYLRIILDADPEVKTARDVQSAAVVLGILVDKARLLLGLPDRVEVYGAIEHSFSTLSERQQEVAERERQLREQFGPVLEAEFRVREASEAAGDGEHYVK